MTRHNNQVHVYIKQFRMEDLEATGEKLTSRFTETYNLTNHFLPFKKSNRIRFIYVENGFEVKIKGPYVFSLSRV